MLFKKSKHSQISVEYLILVGFITLIIMGILLVAFFYSGSIKDRIQFSQITSFANKMVSTAESVYYAGEPSKATITSFLPEGIDSITISNNELILSVQTNSGINIVSFKSNVNIESEGTLSHSSGLRTIVLQAKEATNKVTISSS